MKGNSILQGTMIMNMPPRSRDLMRKIPGLIIIVIIIPITIITLKILIQWDPIYMAVAVAADRAFH